MGSQSSYRQSLRFFVVCFFTFVIIISFVCILCIFGLTQTNFLNFGESNEIFIPNGLKLYDLNYFTFRNHSLYRFDSTNIILRGDDHESLSVVAEDEKNEETLVISTSLHDKNEFHVNCGGVCNCYMEIHEFEGSRRSANLVYSHRYAAVTIVTVLGLAVSKFVNDHIDDCYNNARRVLGYEEDHSSLTCSFDDAIDKRFCDNSGMPYPEDLYEGQGENIRRIFECKGHCLEKKTTKSRFTQRKAQVAMKKMDCTNRRIAETFIEIIKDDKFLNVVELNEKNSGKIGYTNMKLGDHPRYHQAAIRKFQNYYLTPFCKIFRTKYWYTSPGGTSFYKHFSPCSASISEDAVNVRCRQVFVYN